MGKREINDKFYTKSIIAKKCISKINFQKYDTIIEPSAGSGSFSNLIDCEAYDIEPENDNWGRKIIKQDFLELDISNKGKVCIIGNPPFGIRNNLTKKFINHCLSFSNVLTIGFILPQTWNKFTLQKIFPLYWKLIISNNLPNNSFLLNGNDYHVPCVWQIWTKIMNDKINNIKDLRDIEKKDHSLFSLSSVYKVNASFFVLGASPSTIIDINMVKSTQRGYYVITKDKKLRNIFECNKWKGYSGVSGGVSWFTKSDIYKLIEE